MDKLTTLLACLPKSPFKDNLTEEIESLRQQLAAALAACEAKDTILRGITLYRAFNGDDWPAREATQALAIKPDSSALKAHDDALIERCAGLINKLEGAKRNPFSRDHNNGLQHAIDIIRELKERK